MKNERLLKSILKIRANFHNLDKKLIEDLSEKKVRMILLSMLQLCTEAYRILDKEEKDESI